MRSVEGPVDGPTDGIDVSVIVIGRNEGARLARCLASVRQADWGGLRWELLYVDSNSSDDSVEIATRQGARVFGIGGARPCAAAGRNIGLRAAAGRRVLFLDGDTELHRGFVHAAWPVLDDPAVVAVWGHRRESHPRQSLYTRVLDLDWVFAPGSVAYFGGDALVRRAALLGVHGFDDTLVAGEEPDLCRRLRERGWKIEHIDAPMTQHDLAITTARAWWTRAERAGLAYAQLAGRYAGTADPLWQHEARRNRVHALGLLALVPLLATAAVLQPGIATLLVLALVALWVRSALRCSWKCPGDFGLALAYAAHSHLQQLPILAGQWRWSRLRRARLAPQLIEYKRSPSRMHGDRP